MIQKKLFIAAIASLILSLIVLSEVSYLLLDDPVEYRSEDPEEKREVEEVGESESEFKKLPKLPSLDGLLQSANQPYQLAQLSHSKDEAFTSRKAGADLPLFILFCQLKVDLC